MVIDRNHIRKSFTEYTDKYNSSDTKIKLKIDHTFRVAALCDEISESIGLSDSDKDIAWSIGMLHDIGRFEQVRRYNTFSDALSIDHAHFGADLLFKEGLLQSYFDTECIGEDEDSLCIIENAIRNHSAYRVDDSLNDRYTMFCNIIRDADKIDILRVNTELPMTEIYNVSEEELRSGAVTREVLDAFYEEHAVLRSLKKTAVDNAVGHISLIYELVFDVSYSIVKRQGWIDKLLNFESTNPDTIEQFKGIRAHMTEFLDRKTN